MAVLRLLVPPMVWPVGNHWLVLGSIMAGAILYDFRGSGVDRKKRTAAALCKYCVLLPLALLAKVTSQRFLLAFLTLDTLLLSVLVSIEHEPS